MPTKKIATHTSTETHHEKEATMSTPTSKKSHSHHETTTAPASSRLPTGA